MINKSIVTRKLCIYSKSRKVTSKTKLLLHFEVVSVVVMSPLPSQYVFQYCVRMYALMCVLSWHVTAFKWMILHSMTPTLAHHHHQYLTENSVNNSDVIRRYRMLHLNESPLFILHILHWWLLITNLKNKMTKKNITHEWKSTEN